MAGSRLAQQELQQIKYILIAIGVAILVGCGAIVYVVQFGSALGSTAKHVDQSFSKIDSVAAKVSRRIEDERIDEMLEKLHQISESSMLTWLSSDWTQLAFAAMFESAAAMMAKLTALDLDALSMLLDEPTLRRTKHLIYTMDAMTVDAERLKGEIGVETILEVLVHLRNMTESMELITNRLQHSGFTINLANNDGQ